MSVVEKIAEEVGVKLEEKEEAPAAAEKEEEEGVGEEKVGVDEVEEEEEEEEEGDRGGGERVSGFGLEELRKRWVEELERQYEISEKAAERLIAEPQAVLPKLLARVHAEAAQSALQGLASVLPGVIEKAVEAALEKQRVAQRIKERVEGVSEREAKAVVEKLMRAGLSRKEAVAAAAALLEKKAKKPSVRPAVPRSVGPKQKGSIWADDSFWGE